MQPQRPGAAGLLLHTTLGLWLGIYAFRAFVSAAVWNLSDTLPLTAKGALAISVHLFGVAGCVLPFVRRARSPLPIAVAVAVTGTLRQAFVQSDVLGSTFSLLGWVLWLWWLAVGARSIGRASAPVPAIALAAAFVLQVGMQTAWHGLDLPMSTGALATLCTLLLHAGFAWSAAAVDEPVAAQQPARWPLLLGAAFFLELTLLASVGRVGAATGAGLVSSALVIQAGLILGALLVSLATRRWIVYAAAAALLGGSLLMQTDGVAAAVSVVVTQAGLVAVLASGGAQPVRSAARAFAAGAAALFALVFVFYSYYELPVLWPIAALLLVIGALPLRELPRAARPPGWAAAGILLVALGALPAAEPATVSAGGRFSVLTYNVHHGFDDNGVPAMQRIAGEIARADADVVALQEVGRGWTFVGGGDLVAYLRWRFPGYAVHFAPVNGDLWGVALLSRLPLRDAAGAAFDAPAGDFRYGHASGTIRVGGRDVRVVSVHLSAGLEGTGAGSRLDQSGQLLRATAPFRNVVVAGDLNAEVDALPLARLRGGGYTDAVAGTAAADAGTWPAGRPVVRIDYVLLKGELEAAAAEVRPVTASDHRPLLVRLDVGTTRGESPVDPEEQHRTQYRADEAGRIRH